MDLLTLPSSLVDDPTFALLETSSDTTHAPAATDIALHLRSHAFRDLFIDDLGWERTTGCWTLESAGQELVIEAIAHKRGFQVFQCMADRFTVIDRFRLRRIQKKVAKRAHEHIIIYASDQPNRQVWQWGLRTLDGKRYRHLEHPFFSDAPPPKLLARLAQLRFALVDEEAVTLLDAVARVRHALGAEAEQHLFAKRPRYARRSDELARAMAHGGVEEFQEFILFHQRLIPFLARKCRGLHVDQDEAEQLFALGVMRAARLYDPDRGFQFATYATASAKRVARRLASDFRFLLRLPQYVLPTCYEAHRLKERVLVAEGPQRARQAVDALLADVPQPIAQAWEIYERMLVRLSLSDRREPASREVKTIPSSEPAPETPLIRQEIFQQIHRMLDSLDERERTIVRLYHGFDGEPLTLQAIGDQVGVTRERIRQILEQIHRRLRVEIDAEPEELRALLPG